jgi:hypothetical protein
MSGFLDLGAPSVLAEYSRYLDSDILGKILFKNFFLNVLRFREDELYVPLGRSARYDDRKLCGDAHVLVQGHLLNAEIKVSHVNIVHPKSSRPLKCWSFSRMLYTTRKREKIPFDFAFAIGVHSRGLGDPEYWEDLRNSTRPRQSRTKNFDPETLPHESSYLSRCGIFLLPHRYIQRNTVAVTIHAIERCPYDRFFSWGDDIKKCRRIWMETLRTIRKKQSHIKKEPTRKEQLKLLLQ